jgi:hypothetical protein
MQEINLHSAIFRLFDPNYSETNDDTIRPWINEGNLDLENIEAVSEIWRASEDLIKQLTLDDE